MSDVEQGSMLNNIIEAALFAANKPLNLDQLQGIFSDHDCPEKAVLRQTLEKLQLQSKDRGVELVEVASGFRYQVRQECAPWVSRLWEEKPQRYSRAVLETLVLIAYRQPITRAEIEEVRGVAVSSQIIRTLIERHWVRVIGHREVPGRPALYATTREFLDYFNLKSLDQLPPLNEMRDLETIHAELDKLIDEQESDSEDESAEFKKNSTNSAETTH